MKTNASNTEKKIMKWLATKQSIIFERWWIIPIIGLFFLVYFIGVSQGIQTGKVLATAPPPPTYTLSETVNYVMTLQLPIFVWGGIFLFLWLTKW